MNLANAFANSALKQAGKTAVFWGDDEVRYDRLLQESRWLSERLASDLGVKPGDRVALWLKNCPQFISCLFGILQSGAVVVPINNFLKPHEVSYMLEDAGIDVIISEESAAEALAKLTAARPQLKVWHVEHFQHAHATSPGVTCGRQETDLAIIIYTSGTTGHPKGAMLTHGNLLHNVESCRLMLAAVEGDRFVLLLPMFHSFMLTVCILLPLLIGGSIVLVKSLHPAKNIFVEIMRRQATILPGIPPLFRTLASAQVPPNFPLRLCVSGSAPLPVEVLREFNARIPIPLLEGYGLSESSPVASMNPIPGPWKAGSIGVPIPNVEMSVQNDEGEILPDGVTGEICIRGGNVMLGYWNQPEETARALRNNWLFTGDIGHRDSDGYFYITDRKKDMLLVNGINVYPREIEEVMYQFPGLKEVAVIGKPDHRKGEQPVAYVATNEGQTVDEKALLQFVRERLADYKVPRHIIFLPALPRNATGKILKTSLRQMCKEASEAAVSSV